MQNSNALPQRTVYRQICCLKLQGILLFSTKTPWSNFYFKKKILHESRSETTSIDQIDVGFVIAKTI